jgi:hypothetical protein
MSYEVYVPYLDEMDVRMKRMSWVRETFGYTPYTQVMSADDPVTGNPVVLYLFNKEEEAILFTLKWA